MFPSILENVGQYKETETSYDTPTRSLQNALLGHVLEKQISPKEIPSLPCPPLLPYLLGSFFGAFLKAHFTNSGCPLLEYNQQLHLPVKAAIKT